MAVTVKLWTEVKQEDDDVPLQSHELDEEAAMKMALKPQGL
jgi:hypothetical protein